MYKAFFITLLFVNFILLVNSVLYNGGGYTSTYDPPSSNSLYNRNSLYNDANNDMLNPLYSTYNTFNQPSTYNYGNADIVPYINDYNFNYNPNNYHGINSYGNSVQNNALQPYSCCVLSSGINYNNNNNNNNLLPYAGNSLPYLDNASPYSPYPLTGTNNVISGFENGYSSGSLFPIDTALSYGQNPTIPPNSTPYMPTSYFCIPVCPNNYNNNGYFPTYNSNHLSLYNSPSFLNKDVNPYSSIPYSNGPNAQGLTSNFPLRKSSTILKSERPTVLSSRDAPSQQEKKSANLLSISTLKTQIA